MTVILDDEEDGDAKDACSYYEVIEPLPRLHLLPCAAEDGRTHQICGLTLPALAVQFSQDKIYSGRDCLRLSDLSSAAPRRGGRRDVIAAPAPHAFRLRFRHPRQGNIRSKSSCRCRPEFVKTLDALRQHRR